MIELKLYNIQHIHHKMCNNLHQCTLPVNAPRFPLTLLYALSSTCLWGIHFLSSGAHNFSLYVSISLLLETLIFSAEHISCHQYPWFPFHPTFPDFLWYRHFTFHALLYFGHCGLHYC